MRTQDRARAYALQLLQALAPHNPTRRQFNHLMIAMLGRSLGDVDLNHLLTEMAIDGDVKIDNVGTQQRIRLQVAVPGGDEAVRQRVAEAIRVVAAG